MWHSALASTGSERSRLQPPSAVSVASSARSLPSASNPTFHTAWKPCRLPDIVMSCVRFEPQPHGAAGQRGAERGDRGVAVRLHLLAAEPAAHPQALHGDLVAAAAQHVRDDLLRLARGAACWTGRTPARSRRRARARRASPGRSAPGRRTRTRPRTRGRSASHCASGSPRRTVGRAPWKLSAAMASVHRHQRRQRRVLDLDLARADPRGLQGLAEHPAHRVPAVADLRREERLVVLDARVVHAGHVGGGEHAHHARHFQARARCAAT